MVIERDKEYLQGLLNELVALDNECEWVEFKHNNTNPEEIGEYISAVANSAVLAGKSQGYIVWGVEDGTHEIVGTDFMPIQKAVGNEELENWLLRHLTPKIHFIFHEIAINDKRIAILEVPRTASNPVQFKNQEFIRVGSYKKKLKDHPEKERTLWRLFDQTPFENQLAAENVTSEDVLSLIDYPAYFDLLELPLPDNREGIMSRLQEDEMIGKSEDDKWNISNLGAILFAKDLHKFKHLKRKSVRLMVYEGTSKIKTKHEQEGCKGYACGYEGLIDYISNLLPSNEVIGKALRKSVPMYPQLAVRELVANAIIHQDFSLTGTGPTIEIFDNRMEITNPGIPLVKTERFLDSPPRSRNEKLASFLRMIGICEERGTGIDKVVSETEFYQLPAPIFEKTDEHTRVVLFAHKPLNKMDKQEKIRACYLHACLKYVNRESMTNASLRERFKIEAHNTAIASRIIKDSVEAKLVRLCNPDEGTRSYKYVPFWA